MKSRVAIYLLLSLSSACASLQLHPSPDKLQPWTSTLRDSQPEGPFAAVYRIGQRHLVFIGAQHENQNDSPTFQMIRNAYASFKFDSVIAEGFPTSWGANPARIIDSISPGKVGADGFVAGGETVPTVLGALQQSAQVIGGEADDLEIKRQVSKDGVSDTDLLGFYVLRNVPQWIGELEVKDTADPRLRSLVKVALARQRDRLQLSRTLLPGYDEWLAWYEATNRKPLAIDFDIEEVGPLADGRFGTNKIAFAVSKARDSHLHRLIINHLRNKESVLIVFGGSHLLIHRAALEASLGPPCYAGDDMARAAIVCR